MKCTIYDMISGCTGELCLYGEDRFHVSCPILFILCSLNYHAFLMNWWLYASHFGCKLMLFRLSFNFSLHMICHFLLCSLSFSLSLTLPLSFILVVARDITYLQNIGIGDRLCYNLLYRNNMRLFIILTIFLLNIYFSS